jgi:hypothetical protein
VECDEHGRAGEDLWAAGECAGHAVDDDLLKGADVVADDVLRSLREEHRALSPR